MTGEIPGADFTALRQHALRAIDGSDTMAQMVRSALDGNDPKELLLALAADATPGGTKIAVTAFTNEDLTHADERLDMIVLKVGWGESV